MKIAITFKCRIGMSIMPKCVTTLRGLSSCHCTRTTQLLLKKCCIDGKSFTVQFDWLRFEPLPFPVANVLLLEQLAFRIGTKLSKFKVFYLDWYNATQMQTTKMCIMNNKMCKH